MNRKQEQFLSFAQAAEMLGLSESTLRSGDADTAGLTRVRMGRRVMFPLSALEAFMARKIREAEASKAAAANAVAQAMYAKRRRQASRAAILSIIQGVKK